MKKGLKQMKYFNINNELFERFPYLLKKGEHNPEDLELAYYVFGNELLAREVRELLINDRSSPLLQKYFSFIEEMLSSNDKLVVELAIIGFIESLTNDGEIEALAQLYMGEKAKKAYDDLERFWNRKDSE